MLLAFEAADRELDPAARRALLTFVIVGAGWPTARRARRALIADPLAHILSRDFHHIDPSTTRVVVLELQRRACSRRSRSA